MTKLRKTKYKNVINAALKFEPFDFEFTLNIEIECLKKIKESLEQGDFGQFIGYEREVERINTTLKVLDIALSKTISNSYVNHKNAYRFFNKNQLKYVYTGSDTRFVDNELREEKAWHLYHKLREYWMRHWWV